MHNTFEEQSGSCEVPGGDKLRQISHIKAKNSRYCNNCSNGGADAARFAGRYEGITNTIVQLLRPRASGVIPFIATDSMGNTTNKVLRGLAGIEVREKTNSQRLLEEMLTNPPVRSGAVFNVVISSAQESNGLKESRP